MEKLLVLHKAKNIIHKRKQKETKHEFNFNKNTGEIYSLDPEGTILVKRKKNNCHPKIIQAKAQFPITVSSLKESRVLDCQCTKSRRPTKFSSIIWAQAHRNNNHVQIKQRPPFFAISHRILQQYHFTAKYAKLSCLNYYHKVWTE